MLKYRIIGLLLGIIWLILWFIPYGMVTKFVMLKSFYLFLMFLKITFTSINCVTPVMIILFCIFSVVKLRILSIIVCIVAFFDSTYFLISLSSKYVHETLGLLFALPSIVLSIICLLYMVFIYQIKDKGNDDNIEATLLL